MKFEFLFKDANFENDFSLMDKDIDDTSDYDKMSDASNSTSKKLVGFYNIAFLRLICTHSLTFIITFHKRSMS